MPYELKSIGGKTCVVKKGGSKPVPGGCHANRSDAVKHMRALYKNVPDAKGASVDADELTLDEMTIQLASMKHLATPEPKEPEEAFIPLSSVSTAPSVIIYSTNTTIPYPATVNETFHTVTPEAPTTKPIRLYFREGEQTPDGRIIDPNAVNFNRPPPYAIRLQTTQPESGGHAGAVVCGVITNIVRDGLTIVCDGRLDLNTDAGRQAFDLISRQTMQTWSPDLGDAVIDREENVTDEDPNLLAPEGQVDHFISATFLGATLVAMPALASAVVELLNDDGTILVPAPSRVAPQAPAAGVSQDPSMLKYITERTDNQSGLSASAGYAAPDPSFFTKPELTELQRWVTVTDEGRVYGHVAGFGECHIGYRNECITIDVIDKDLSSATPGYVVCSDGSKVATGPIAIKGGHAAKGLRWQEVLSHYDDPSSVVADVAYFWDDFGISFSGAIRPGATDEQVYTLRASGVSLDAREIDGRLRHLATCCVNTPGFPKAQARLMVASADAEPQVLVLIAPGDPPLSAEDCECDEPVQVG